MHKRTQIVMMFFMVTTLLLSACSGGSYSLRSGNIEADKDRIYGSYQRFHGSYYRKVSLNEGDRVHFDFHVRTEEGSLQALILDDEDEKLLTISNDDTITVPEEGTFTMQVEAADHMGSFELHWTIDE